MQFISLFLYMCVYSADSAYSGKNNKKKSEEERKTVAEKEIYINTHCVTSTGK